jgi:hypothetical protein
VESVTFSPTQGAWTDVTAMQIKADHAETAGFAGAAEILYQPWLPESPSRQSLQQALYLS